VGSLLVGLTYGKALALTLGKPLIAVNHIEGHVHAVFLEARQGEHAPGVNASAPAQPGAAVPHRRFRSGSDAV